MRRFCVFKRNNHRFYYAQIKNPDTGKYLPARSTGTTDKTEAYMIAIEWLQNGLPNKKNSANKQPIHKVLELGTLIHALDTVDLTTQDALRITSILQKKGLIGNVSTKMSGKNLPMDKALESVIAMNRLKESSTGRGFFRLHY